MFNKTSQGMIQTTVLLSPQFNDLRKKYHITLSEAVRVGISMILAERGVEEYDNKLNISRKINLIRQELETKSNELEELKNKNENNNSI